MKQKLLVAALALTLVLCLALGGTLAWLTSRTKSIVNTFVIGNITISLMESDSDSDGDAFANEFKMTPGATITKDPVLTVSQNSEDCYVFFKVDEQNNDLDSEKIINYTPAAGWTQLMDGENEVEGVFYRVVTDVEEDMDFHLFLNDTVTVNEALAEVVNNPVLTITGYAVQRSSVAEAEEAAKPLTAWNLVKDLSDPA